MTYRQNALDQALDIAGSLIKSADFNLSEEFESLGSPISGQSGSIASIDLVNSGIATISGLTGMTASSIGRFLTLSGADNLGNNGTFLISGFISDQSVEVVNASAVESDLNNVSLSWVERNPYSLEDDLNYVRTDRAAIKGVNYYDSIPTYVRPTATNVNVSANLANIAGHTTDAKVLIANRKFESVSINAGDSSVTLISVGNLKHADSIDITGVPVWDGYDSGNWASTYVEINSNFETELFVNGGEADGYRIFGRARAGSESSPDGIEVEFRAVPLGGSLSSSVPYTWDSNQPTNINLYYPYRETLAAMDENALRTLMVNGLMADPTLTGDIYLLIGSPENSTDLNGSLTNTTNYYPFSNLPDATPTIVDALNVLNEQIGDRTYSSSLLTDGYSITASLQELANALEGASCIRIIERANGLIPANSVHTLPGGATYTVDPTNNAQNMWVFVRGVLRDPGSVTSGNEYEEVSSTSIRLYFKVNPNDHINYVIFK